MNEERRPFSWKETLLQGMTQLIVLILAILFFFLIFKIKTLYAFVMKIFRILMPVVLGFVIAYLLNPMVKKIEGLLDDRLEVRVKNKTKRKKAARLIAILCSMALFVLALYVLLALVVPEIYENIRKVVYDLPGQVTSFVTWAMAEIKDDENLRDMILKIYDQAMAFLTNWMKTDMMTQIVAFINGVVGVFKALFDVLVGIIVAVYILISKETFKRQGKKVIYALLNDRQAEILIDILKQSDRIFGGFITGKILDSIIIGILCFIGALILRLPYPALISVIVGVTNVIPVFGPYIGAVPSSILILLASPSKGIVFIIFILLLQQFDGNIIGPKILGESTGLSSFWVIFAILLGGGLFGVPGMAIGVPTFGVIYYLIRRFINYRLAKKNLTID